MAYFRGVRKKKKVFPHRLGISDEWTALSSKSVKINLLKIKNAKLTSFGLLVVKPDSVNLFI